jgi:hypothetical protein
MGWPSLLHCGNPDLRVLVRPTYNKIRPQSSLNDYKKHVPIISFNSVDYVPFFSCRGLLPFHELINLWGNSFLFRSNLAPAAAHGLVEVHEGDEERRTVLSIVQFRREKLLLGLEHR